MDDIMIMMAKEYCGGNIGALSFFCEGLKFDTMKANEGFARMYENGITNDKLYMLWNDCCDRDTKRAVYIMLHDNIDSIHKHINYGNGRGIPYTEAEPEPYKREKDGEWYIFTFLNDGKKNSGKCVKIKGTYGEAREKMVDKYGTHFAFQYLEEEWETNWNNPDRFYRMEDIIEIID